MSRSAWKPIFRHPQARDSLNLNEIVIQNRSTFITSSMINRSCAIYNGRRWFHRNISNERVGNCVGQYAPTRKRPVHKKQTKK